jgi:adenosine/AMP kinase
VDLLSVTIDRPDELNVIVGQAPFIKTMEDIRHRHRRREGRQLG